MHSSEDIRLTPDDEQLIEIFRRHYSPPARTAAQRLAMRDALQERLQRPWLPIWSSLAAAACVAALALWVVLPAGWTSAPETGSAASGEVLAAYALDGDAVGDVDDLLPHAYATIEDIFDL
jgi:hypothetical protein